MNNAMMAILIVGACAGLIRSGVAIGRKQYKSAVGYIAGVCWIALMLYVSLT